MALQLRKSVREHECGQLLFGVALVEQHPQKPRVLHVKAYLAEVVEKGDRHLPALVVGAEGRHVSLLDRFKRGHRARHELELFFQIGDVKPCTRKPRENPHVAVRSPGGRLAVGLAAVAIGPDAEIF